MEPQTLPRFTVKFAKVASYDHAAVTTAGELLDSLKLPIAPGDRVLVKPNLLRANVLACTHAVITAGVCRYLRDRGCRVTVGDSPGFGTAKGVAKAIGLNTALEQFGCADLPFITLDLPVRKPLTLGGSLGLSRHALETDHILNLPKLKAHSQMRVTGATKNLFGCISGIRKAVLHSQYGDKERDGIAMFPSAVADILRYLPPVTTLMDGVTAMHVSGPSAGREFPAHFLAASKSPVALDTAVYSMLGVPPEEVPLWHELRRRNEPGSFFEEIILSGENIATFDLSGFILPYKLLPQTFNPIRLMVSTTKRLWARLVTVKG